MVSDKEILMQAAEKYAKGIASNFSDYPRYQFKRQSHML